MNGGNRYFILIAFFILSLLVPHGLTAVSFKLYLGWFILLSSFFLFRRYNFSRVLFFVVAVSSSLLFLYGIFQRHYIFPRILSNIDRGESVFSKALYERVISGRVFSIFSIPTLYGFICSVLIIFIIYRLYGLIRDKKKKKSIIIFYALLFFLGIYNLILTQTFGSVLNLIIGLLAFLIFKRKIQLKILVPVITSVFLLIFIIVGLRYNEAKNLEPIKLRLTNWNQAIRMISQNPFFGVGLGNYGMEVSKYTKEGEARSIYTHNFFLQLTAELGLPLFIFLLLLMFINRKKLMPKIQEDTYMYVSILLMLVFYNLTDIGIYFFPAGFILIIILSQIYRKETKNYVFPLIIFIISSILYGFIFLSDESVREGNILLSQNKKAESEISYRKGLSLNPYNFTAMVGSAITLKKGIYSEEGRQLINKALYVYPEYSEAIFYKSLADYKQLHLLTSLYYAGLAHKNNSLNKQYGKWYEFIKKHLPSRNSVK